MKNDIRDSINNMSKEQEVDTILEPVFLKIIDKFLLSEIGYDLERIKHILENTSIVYQKITGGKISRPETCLHHVIQECENHFNEEFDKLHEEYKEEVLREFKKEINNRPDIPSTGCIVKDEEYKDLINNNN